MHPYILTVISVVLLVSAVIYHLWGIMSTAHAEEREREYNNQRLSE